MWKHQGSRIPLWDENRSPICEQIAARRAPFKILMKTKDEPEFLAEWIDHHARIVGRENLIIADNESTDPAMLAALSEVAEGSIVFRFSGFHNFIHDRTRFPELYAALKQSCKYYMFMDSDERLIWTDGETWIADDRILECVAACQPFSILPGVMLDNFTMERDTFHFSGAEAHNRELVRWGKPVVSTAADVSGSDVLHLCQFPAGFTDADAPINIVSLHLSRLNPDQRLKANRSKMVVRGRVTEGTSFEEIAALPDQVIQNDEVVLRCVREIRDILGFLDPKSETSWGPVDKAFSIKIKPDGTIGFPNEWIKENFSSFVRLGTAYLPNKNRERLALMDHDVMKAVKLSLADGNYEVAKLQMQAGMTWEPHLLDAYGDPFFNKELIRLLLSEGRLDEARALIPQPEGPGRPGWHHILFGRTLSEAGRHDEARPHWEAFSAIEPFHPEVQKALESQAAPIKQCDPLEPRMSPDERKLLSRYLRDTKKLLEFGAGGSTALAARLGVQQIVSIDSDRSWLDLLARQDEITKVSFRPYYIDVGKTGDWGFPLEANFVKNWPGYYRSVWSSLEWIPDLVLVDGRFRVACVLTSVLETTAQTTIIIHDFWDRPEYHIVLDHLDFVERVDSIGVFKSKVDVDWKVLSRNLIDHALDPR